MCAVASIISLTPNVMVNSMVRRQNGDITSNWLEQPTCMQLQLYGYRETTTHHKSQYNNPS